MSRYYRNNSTLKEVGIAILSILVAFAVVASIVLLVNTFHPFLPIEQAAKTTSEVVEATSEALRI